MKKESLKKCYIAFGVILAFVLWTVLVLFVDVKPIGPQGSEVGFATLNEFFHNLTSVHMSLYFITDWLSLIPLCFIVGFAIAGLFQWIKRRKLSKVDYSLFVLGGFYIVVMAVYILFEFVVVNYRPILIDGFLEASYPSSTTMLVMCVMPTAIMQLTDRIKNNIIRVSVAVILSLFSVFMVVGRLLSGVHWLSDIIGGALISCGLVMLYCAFVSIKK